MLAHPRVSVNGVSSRRWSLAEDLAFWRDAGITRVVLPLDKARAAGLDEAASALAEADLEISSVCLGRAFTLGEPERWADERAALREGLRFAERVGAGGAYVTTGPSRSRMSVDESVEAFCRAVRPVVAEGVARGVPLAVEQNHALTHDVGAIHTFADLVDVAEDTGIGIVVELQNCWTERGLAALFARAAGRLALVQVSDFAVGTETRLSRLVPGDGDIALEGLLADLLDSGYPGLFDLEILGPRIEAEGYPGAITRGVAWLSDRLTRLIPDPPAGDTSRTKERSR
ncbi:MAG: sugar phosphate isomerase/epimerase [Pseudonocardia sp.]|nr:sugar phosphate isomerase/epimerase [Pseudonocardia sp.]